MITTSPIAALADAVRLLVRRAADGPGRLYREAIDAAEKPLLEAVLEHTRGNQIEAAAMLGISRNTLRKLLRRHGLEICDRAVRAVPPSRFKAGGAFSFDYRSMP